MEICTGRHFESVHPKPCKGSYEWWYYDGWDERTKSGFVLIFYDGNPFSSRYIRALRMGKWPHASAYPAMSLSIYHRGRPVYYAFDEWNREQVLLEPPERIEMPGVIGTFREADGEAKIHIHLDHRMESGDSLRGSIELSSSPFAAILDRRVPSSPSSLPEGNHRWNLVLPEADVRGDISIGGHKPLELNLHGHGYHDHNIGMEPMSASFDQWYWGRFHLPGRTLIYYLMEVNGEWDQRAWMIEEGEAESLQAGIWSLTDPVTNWFGLQSSRKLEYKGRDRSIQIDHGHMLDNGPFYQRFASRLRLQEVDRLTNCEGIGEMIRPHRIGQRRFRPLVEMRIRYPDRTTHWVQRFSRLYRWTW